MRKVRRINHLTQVQLAQILGRSAPAIDSWESGRNFPRDLLATAAAIETAFDLPRGWMLGYADGLPHLDSNQKPAGEGDAA